MNQRFSMGQTIELSQLLINKNNKNVNQEKPFMSINGTMEHPGATIFVVERSQTSLQKRLIFSVSQNQYPRRWQLISTCNSSRQNYDLIYNPYEGFTPHRKNNLLVPSKNELDFSKTERFRRNSPSQEHSKNVSIHSDRVHLKSSDKAQVDSIKEQNQEQANDVKPFPNNKSSKKQNVPRNRVKSPLKIESKDKTEDNINSEVNLLEGKDQNLLQSLGQYLENERPFSRYMANTTFSKFYNKPCPQAYGRSNSSKKFGYHDSLKTHNIMPHSKGNDPETYQTYKNALKNAKRSKKDLSKELTKLQRQLARQSYREELDRKMIVVRSKSSEQLSRGKNIVDDYLNHEIVNAFDYRSKVGLGDDQEIHNKKEGENKLLKSLENGGAQIIYRHSDDEKVTKLSKNRHGLTCYVDPNFSQNQEATTKFLKSQNRIYPQKVEQQDRQIDKIKIANYLESKEKQYPSHYMIPCVETPYDKSKYQFRKKSSSNFAGSTKA